MKMVNLLTYITTLVAMISVVIYDRIKLTVSTVQPRCKILHCGPAHSRPNYFCEFCAKYRNDQTHSLMTIEMCGKPKVGSVFGFSANHYGANRGPDRSTCCCRSTNEHGSVIDIHSEWRSNPSHNYDETYATSPATLAQLLQPSLAFCCNLQFAANAAWTPPISLQVLSFIAAAPWCMLQLVLFMLCFMFYVRSFMF